MQLDVMKQQIDIFTINRRYESQNHLDLIDIDTLSTKYRLTNILNPITIKPLFYLYSNIGYLKYTFSSSPITIKISVHHAMESSRYFLLLSFTQVYQSILYQIGKQLTIKYAHKLSYISPCWYELIIKNNIISFQNTQLIDHNYLQQIKSANPSIKILPRIYLNNIDLIKHTASTQQNFKQLLKLIISVFQIYPYDGIVWDSPFNLYIDQKQRAPLNSFMHQLTNSIKQQLITIKQQNHKQQLLLFFNIANPSSQKINTHLYQTLNIDALLIQNYDSHIDFHQMIKNSIKYINHNQIKTKLIFLLLPFFSYKNNQPISTQDVQKQLTNDGLYSKGFERGMCRFLSKKNKKYLVPCHKYFSQAYKLIKSSEFEVGYWQGGNGLENYYKFM